MKTIKGRSPPTKPAQSKADISYRHCTTAPIGQIIQLIIQNLLNQKIMKTTEVKTAALNNKAENTNSPAKINGLPVSTAFDGDSKMEEAKKAETPVTVQPEQPKAGQVNAGTEPTKKEVKEGLREKTIFDFDSTIKLVEELHRKKIQRDKLLNTINTLEAFEVAQQEDAEETDSNNFQGCIMTIQDDKRREFTTKNPVIIQEAAQHVNAMCLTKLAEIEAGIVIPS